MNKGDRLNELVREAGKNNLSGDRISELMVTMAGSSYWLSEEVSELYKQSLRAEADLDNALVLAELKLIAAGMAISKAHTAAKNDDNALEARNTYIILKGDYEKWKSKLKGIERLLSALQMRLSFLTKEKQYSNTIRTT